MTNPNGTNWETAIVERATGYGLAAMRLVKKSQKDEADVLLPGDENWHIPVLFWKRIIKTGKKVRQPLGERYVAVLGLEDFLDLLSALHGEAWGGEDGPVPTVWVQAKWAEQVSVTKILGGLRSWLAAKLAA